MNISASNSVLSVPSVVKRDFIPLRPAEKKVFRRRHRLPGPAWAEKNIHVPIGSRQGLYRNTNNPAMYGVLDWATRSHVRVVVMAKGIQVGGTIIFYALLLREGEYSSDKALVVMADERTVKKLSKGRLRVMIDKSPTLSALKSDNPDDTSIYNIELANGFTIDIGWASSEMSVSSESYRVVILDEISKYKVRGNIEDGKSRTTVHRDTCRIWILSSPGVDTDDPNTRDPLMVEVENCDVMLEYHAICPDCGQEQVMLFDQFRWPGQMRLTTPQPPPKLGGGAERSEAGVVDADPREIRRTRSAYYQCAHCPSRWNDYKRDKAVLSAMKTGWKSTDPQAPELPLSVYFHFPSWLSPFVSLSDVAADWLEAQGDEEKLRKWHNRHAAVSYRYGSKARATDHILRLVDPHLPAGIIPDDTSTIAVLADTQQNGFMYQVIAYGYGPDILPTLVEHGFVETFDALTEIQNRPYSDSGGKTYQPHAGFIDSGGGTNPHNPKHSRTSEVYEFCRLNKFWRPGKGRRDQATPWTTTRLDYYPSRDGKKKPIPGGLNLYTINVTLYKNQLASKLEINPGDPGAIRLHAGVMDDGPHGGHKYAAQLCAEYRDDRGYWQCPRGKANHFWDCWVYAFAIADILGVRRKTRPTADAPAKPQTRIIYSQGVGQ